MKLTATLRPILRMIGISNINLEFHNDQTVSAAFDYQGKRVKKTVNLADVQAEINGHSEPQAAEPQDPTDSTHPPPNAD